MHKIEQLSEEQARPLLPQLVALLQDSVHNGSSVGFLPPLTFEAAEEYWLETLDEVARGKRILLVSSEGADVTGAVQLALATKQNGLHRAEVQKLVVHTGFRNRGIARALLGAAEESARARRGARFLCWTRSKAASQRSCMRSSGTRARE